MVSISDTIREKYEDLNLSGTYLYNYKDLKHSGYVPCKKPEKIFYANDYVKKFYTSQKGNLKILREFQNLYIHKFLINIREIKDRDKDKEKFKFKLFQKKEKNRRNDNGFDINKSKEKRITHENNLLQPSNVLLDSSNKRNTSFVRRINYRTIQKAESDKKLNTLSKNTSSSLINKKNSRIQNLKGIRNFSAFSLNGKSRLTLIKEISEKILSEKNQNGQNHKNKRFRLNKNKSANCLNHNHNLGKYKSLDLIEKFNNSKNISLINNFENHKSSNIKYYEISRRISNLSNAIIIKKQAFPCTAKRVKIKKRNKIPLRLFSCKDREMSSLEKYYLKFGIFPFY